MESSSHPPSGAPDPAAARAALDEVAATRERSADRLRSPWWYHFSQAVIVFVMFGSISVGGDVSAIGPPLGAVLVVLTGWAATRARGVSLPGDYRHSEPWVLWSYFALFVLFGGVGMYLEIAHQLRGAMAVAGLLLVAPSIATSRHVERAVRRATRNGA